MHNQKCVEFKRVKFCGDFLVIKLIRKRKPIKVKIEDIESLYYAKWSLRNYFSLIADFKSPGALIIILKSKCFLANKSMSCLFKYDDLEKIPRNFKKLLEIK